MTPQQQVQQQFDARVAGLYEHRRRLVDRIAGVKLFSQEGQAIASDIGRINRLIALIASEYAPHADAPTPVVVEDAKPIVRLELPKRLHVANNRQRGKRRNNARKIDHDAAYFVPSEINCSLRQAPPPWMLSWGNQYKNFSDMLPIPNFHVRLNYVDPHYK